MRCNDHITQFSIDAEDEKFWAYSPISLSKTYSKFVYLKPYSRFSHPLCSIRQRIKVKAASTTEHRTHLFDLYCKCFPEESAKRTPIFELIFQNLGSIYCDKPFGVLASLDIEAVTSAAELYSAGAVQVLFICMYKAKPSDERFREYMSIYLSCIFQCYSMKLGKDDI